MQTSPHGFPDWDLLTTWVTLVESGSVSNAARALKISQAAVSQRIKLLEASLSTSLLDRSTRPAQPTAAGMRLFESATELLVKANQMVEGVRTISRAKRLIVRFGCVDSFAATVGPLLIKALSGSSRQLRMWAGITPALDEAIEGRQLDLAVTTGTLAHAGVTRVRLFSENYAVALPVDFELPQPGSLRDLAKTLPLIRYSARSHIGEQIDGYLLRQGDALERNFEFDTTDPLLSLVEAGMGFAITTPLCLWQSRHFASGIRVIPLTAFQRDGKPYPPLQRVFQLAYREGEFGSLPNEVRELVRIGVRQQLYQKIERHFGVAAGVLQLDD